MFGTGKTGAKRVGGGLFGRLARDRAGNTLAIVGAALLPLAGIIGSGVDMSRAYMAKSRLQSACDAGALAGRRVMVGDTMDNNVRDEAVRFFNFNFAQGLYQTDAFTPQVTRPSVATVRVTAATKIPTTIMRLFGFDKIDLSVECEASQNFVNTDVMLVLDVTGSMNRNAADQNTSVDSERKIYALRQAVMALYQQLKPTQDQLASAGMRLRYGVVPYSTTVNVGSSIRAVNAAYISNNWTYPSRTPFYTTTSTQRVGTNLTSAECGAYAQARTPASGYPATQKNVARPGSGTRRACDVTTITYSDSYSEGATEYWTHEPRVFDTSSFKMGTATALPTRPYGSNTTSSWNGCIEERDTTTSINGGTSLTIPDDAYDLNIDLIPNNADTRWRPAWRQVVYFPTSGQLTQSSSDDYSLISRSSADQDACPRAAERMKIWTESEMQSYVNGLTPQGFTYHDIGMIWGARMLSPDGVFAADNPDTFNEMPVARHIIFMTDGQLSTNSAAYSGYGVESIEGRVTGGASNANARHLQRFRMICNAAKAKNFSIWVIAFGTSLSAEMTECASNANQASTASDRDELIERFRQIGHNIGALRLTQ